MTEKKNTKKSTTKQKVEKVEETVVKETEVKPQRKSKKQLDRDELVTCRNTRNGSLIYISKKTGIETVWEGFGATEELTIGELMTMKSSQPAFLKNGWLVIEDEDVLDYLKIKKIEDEYLDLDDLDAFFEKNVDEMSKALDVFPQGIKETIATHARKLIEEEKLDSNRVIRLLEDKLKIDLSVIQ